MYKRQALLCAHGNQAVEHGVFQLPLEGTAAHDPEVNVSLARGSFMRDQRGDDSVVTEFVHQPSIKGDVLVIVHQGFYFGGRVAACGQIELVGFVDQLCDPCLLYTSRCV